MLFVMGKLITTRYIESKGEKKRVFPFLDKLLAERKNQNVCLVCHGGVGLIICEYFEGTPKSNNLLDFSAIRNGEAIIFER